MIEVLNKIKAAGGTIEVLGGDLRLRVPKGLLSSAERLLLAEHKVEIITLLADEKVVEAPVENTTDSTVEAVVNNMMDQDLDEPVEEIVPPPACRQCGSLELWQTLAGTWRCLRCDPPIHARRLEEKARQLREQFGSNLLKRIAPIDKMAEPSQVGTSTRLLTTTQT
jgi:hypothetical protein